MTGLKEKWQSGDVGAFEALYNQYKNLVYKTAFLIAGQKEEAEDILQEVFVSVWKSRDTYDSRKGKITTWLHTITVNHCNTRQRKKRPAVSLEENMPVLSGINSGDDPEQSIMNKQEYETVINTLNTLDAKHRVVLVLRYFNELSYDEIARIAGIPLGTVKSRINTALKYLREQLIMEKQEAS
jgi:RNA polymerase sigma-70 factor (ECF subfamily)